MATASELPLDVLRLVFAHFALRPRLLVIALVCRRWRTAAYASVTSISHPLAYGGPLDRFPNVTDICIPRAGLSRPWTPEQCARITSLDLRHPLALSDPLAQTSLPSLVSLRCVASWSRDESALRFLFANSTITQLCTNTVLALPRERPFPLPLLRSFAVEDRWSTPLDLSGWEPALAQITDLSFQATLREAPPPLPALRRLTVRAIAVGGGAAWLSTLTSLTELDVRVLSPRHDAAELLLAAAPALTHLALSSRASEATLSALLERATKLRCLRLKADSLPSTWRGVASRLRSLHLVSVVRVPSAWVNVCERVSECRG